MLKAVYINRELIMPEDKNENVPVDATPVETTEAFESVEAPQLDEAPVESTAFSDLPAPAAAASIIGAPTPETTFESAPVTPPFSNPVVSSQPETVIGSGPSLPEGVTVIEKPKKSKRLIFIGAIVAAALVVFGGGGALAYNVWYQNPEKVVADAIVNAITAKTVSATGTFDLETDDYSMNVEVSARNSSEGDAASTIKLDYTVGDYSLSMSGEGMFSADGDLYVKVNNVRDLIDSIEEQSSLEGAYDVFDDIITKVDGNWIKISKDDLGEVSEEYEKTQKCLADISKSIESDATFRKTIEKETARLYQENKFIIVGDKIGSRTINGQGSLGYTLTGDAEVADDFFTKFGDTELGKRLKECNKDISYDDIVSDSAKESEEESETVVEIWVSRFGHSITEISIKSDEDGTKGSLVINPEFNKNETVEIPTETIPFSELQSDIENAYEDYYASYYETYYDDYYSTYESDTSSSTLYN